MTTILLVEDESGISEPLSLYLSELGFTIEIARDGESALDIFAAIHPDLLVLDINLPKRDGFLVCERIRETSNTPIVMLSARDSEDDKVRALELGADDYVSKPFSPRELVARIQAILKRFQKNSTIENTKSLSLGSLTLDIPNYSLRINGEDIKITKTEFLLLAYLINHQGQVVEREKLMKDIMGYDHYLYDRTIDTHMKNLRHKLGAWANIETIRGVGYRIESKQS